MSTKSLKGPQLWDNITLLADKYLSQSMSSLITSQINECYIQKKSLLQQINENIYVLSIPRDNKSVLDIKKISDRVQYSILPGINDEQGFTKLKLEQIKNFNFRDDCPSWFNLKVSENIFSKKVLIFFYYQKKYFFEKITEVAKLNKLDIETIEEESIKFIYDDFETFILMNEIVSKCIWKNQNLKEIFQLAAAQTKLKFNLYQSLHNNLKKNFKVKQHQRKITLEQNGIDKNFNYQEATEQILALGFEDKIQSYLEIFEPENISIDPWFETLVIRSLNYLKVRPDTLHQKLEGYIVACAKEYQEKQIPIKTKKNISTEFKLWQKRAHNKLNLHNFKARVITCNHKEIHSVGLIGEKISSLAISPKLIKGALEELQLDFQGMVKLTAYTEDTLVISKSDCSWAEISDMAEKTTGLSNMISSDGCDSLDLFLEVELPKCGAGLFSFKIIPNSFFKLVDTAVRLKNNVNSGHNHYLFGLAYQCLYEPQLAINEFKKALRFDSNDADVLGALGNGLKDIGNFKEAFLFLKKAFDITPKNAELANDLGEISFKIGELNTATFAFEKAVELQPASASYLSNLGKVYLHVQRENDALVILNEALRCDPAFAHAHENLALLYKKLGDIEMARKHALMAYDANPINQSIANLLWQLTMDGKKK